MPDLPAYRLVRSRRRTLALIVEQDGALLVRAPLRLSKKIIEETILSKSDWIAQKQALARQNPPKARQKNYQEGDEFPFLGQRYPLKIIEKQREALTYRNNSFYLAQRAQKNASQAFENWYRQQARQLLSKRVAELAALHTFHVKNIRITSARTRWGSCSTKGSLNFSWRVILLPMPVIDYIILHELAHLRFHNHAAPFWNLVATLMPDYQERRSWLRRNARSLID
jgi:predicted metal-dependent hydrolase